MSRSPSSLRWVLLILFAIVGLFYLSAAIDWSRPAAGLSWNEVREVARGKAYRGPWRMNDSEFLYVDDPTVGCEGPGTWGTAWVDNEAKDIFFQSYNSVGEALLSQPTNVSRSPDIFSWLPRLVQRAEHVYILWQEIIFSGGSHGGEILFARSTDHGRSFSDPINLSNTTAGAGKGRLSRERWDNGSLDLAVAPDGSLYAAWTEYEGRLHFSRSLDQGQSFSEPQLVAGSDQRPTRAPSLAAAADRVYLAWTEGDDEEADIYYVQSTDQGASFSETQVAIQSRRHADAPRLALSRSGTLHLVFAERRLKATETYRIFYSRKRPDATVFESPRQISGYPFGWFSSSSFPELATAGEHIFVIWSLRPPMKPSPLGLGFNFSVDDGRTFSHPSVIPGTSSSALGANGGLQGGLMRRLAACDEGEIAVLNSSFAAGRSSHIRLFRGKLRSL